jgi:uncharacterized protein with PhoU and TrkA domain
MLYEDLERLTKKELIKVIHDCEEILGLITVNEYATMIGKSKRHVFDLIHANKIEYIHRDGVYYVIVNDHIK